VNLWASEWPGSSAKACHPTALCCAKPLQNNVNAINN
jgi:hypothetical protein